MEQRVFAFLLISGFCTLHSCLCHQYYFVQHPKTWAEAQSYCRENYTDLATIGTTDEQEAMMLEKTGSEDLAWIGLRAEWQWSVAGQGHSAETESLTWRGNEPNNKGGHEDCAAIRKYRGKFLDHSCTSSFCFICYNESSADRYILIKQKKTWENAQQYCRNNHTDLLSLRNSTERENIKEKLRNEEDCFDSPDWWISLFRNWVWSNQSMSSYRNWVDDQNNENGDHICAAVSFGSGKWKKESCLDRKHFFCYEDNLVLVRENKTWDEALHYCRQHHHDLVSTYAETVLPWVKRRVREATTPHVWLGLRFSCALHIWHWVSSEQFCTEALDYVCGYTGAMESTNQQVHSLPKTERFNFICSI